MEDQYAGGDYPHKSLHAGGIGVPVQRPRWEYLWAAGSDEMNALGAVGWRAVPGSYDVDSSYHLMERPL